MKSLRYSILFAGHTAAAATLLGALGAIGLPVARAQTTQPTSALSTDEWKSLDATGLAQLEAKLRASATLSDQELLGRVHAFAVEARLVGATRDSKVPLTSIPGAIAPWVNLLSPQEKADLRAAVNERYLRDVEGLRRLPFEQIYSYVVWNGSLGASREDLAKVARQWMTQSEIWKTCPPSQFITIHGFFDGDKSAEAKECRAAIVSEVLSRELCNGEWLSKAKGVELSERVGTWGQYLNAAQKREVRAQVSSLWVDRPERLAKLSTREFLSLEGAWLYSLEASAGEDLKLVSAWGQASADWKEAAPMELYQLVQKVNPSTQPELAEWRRSMVSLGIQKLQAAEYEKTPALERASVYSAWSALMMPAQKVPLRTALLKEWSEKERLAKTGREQQAQVQGYFTSLELPPQELSKWVVASIESGQRLPGAGGSELVGLQQALGASEEASAVAARRQIQAALREQIQKDDFLQKEDVPTSLALGHAVAAALPVEDHTLVRGAVLRRFGAQVLPSLKPAEVLGLGGFVVGCGGSTGEAATVVGNWVEKSNSWKDLNPQKDRDVLVGLLTILEHGQEVGSAALTRMTEQLWTGTLNNAAVVAKLDSKLFFELAQAYAPYLTQVQRKTLADSVFERVAGPTKNLKDATPEDIALALGVLVKLGQNAKATSALVQYIDESPQANAALTKLLPVAAALPAGKEPTQIEKRLAQIIAEADLRQAYANNTWQRLDGNRLAELVRWLRNSSTPKEKDQAEVVRQWGYQELLLGGAANPAVKLANVISVVPAWTAVLSDAEKSKLANQIAKRASEDRAGTAKLTFAEWASVLTWTGQLGASESELGQMTLSWMSASESWRGCETSQLPVLYGGLSANKDERSAQQRGMIVSEVLTRELCNAEWLKKAKAGELTERLSTWGQYLSAAQKQEVRAQVGSVWVDRPDALAKLSTREFLSLESAWVYSVGASAGEDLKLVSVWGQASTGWKEASPMDLYQLVQKIDPAQPSELSEWRRAMVALGVQKLQSPEYAQKTPPLERASVYSAWSSLMTSAQKAPLRTAIVKEWSEKERLAKTGREQQAQVQGYLITLELPAPELAAWTVASIESGQRLPGAGVYELVSLHQALAAGNKEADAARRQVQAALREQIQKEDFLQKEDTATALAMGQSVASVLPAGDQALLRGAVMKRFTPEAVANLKAGEVVIGLSGFVAASGGSPQEAAKVVGDWASKSNSWKDLDPRKDRGALVGLLTILERGQEAGSEGLNLIVSHLWTGTLNNQAVVAKLETKPLLDLAQTYAPYLNQGQRKILGNSILSKIDEQMKSVDAKTKEIPAYQQLGPQTISQCVMVLADLDHENRAAELLLEYAASHSAMPADGAKALVDAAKRVLAADLSVERRKSVLTRFQQAVLAEAKSTIDAPQARMAVVRWLMQSGEKEKAVEQTQAYYRELLAVQDRSKVSGIELFGLAACILYCDAPNEGKLFPGYPDFVQLLAPNLKKLRVYEESDGEYACYLMFATPLATPAAQAALEAKLNSPDLDERVVAARIVTTVRKLQGGLTQWQSELDRKLAAGALKSDARAELLLMRAYATEIESWDRAPLSGKKYIDQSLACDPSEAVKLVIVEFMTHRYETVHEFDLAQSLIESLEPQMTAKASQARLRGLKEFVESRRGQRVEIVARASNDQEKRRVQGELELLQEQLKVSRKRERPAAVITSLEQQIKEARARLASLQ